MADAASEVSKWPELQRVRRAIVVVDVVESVRLMQQDESGVIDRWRRFVREARDELLPRHDGRMVKSLGDGMLMAFNSASHAVAAAIELNQLVARYDHDVPDDRRLWLRTGVHAGEIVDDEIDVFGVNVNIAARLAGIAARGEIVVSAEVRSQIVDGLDAEAEDIGECWLKHIAEPVRAARIRPAGVPLPGAWAPAPADPERIGVAVIPLTERDGVDPALGDLAADDIIAQLSRVENLKVISRWSTAAFRAREQELPRIARMLGVDYVMHGSVARKAAKVRIHLQLTHCDDASIVWADSFEAPLRDLRQGFCDAVDRAVALACRAMMGREASRACLLPLPTLKSCTILLGATSRLHSLSLRDFEQSREMLEFLVERHPRQAAPRAWLGLWHVMRVGQGWSTSPAIDAGRAQQVVGAALELEPENALSLAVDGLIAAYIHKDMQVAGERYDAAVRANPNEGLAWLYRSAWHAYREEGASAVECALRAQSLSPLDPLRYYYDNFTSTAMLAHGDLDGAIRYGARSLQGNALHGPTVRILAIAHSLRGDMDAARAMVDRMRRLEPSFSLERFQARYPGTRSTQVARYVEALRAAGMPEH